MVTGVRLSQKRTPRRTKVSVAPSVVPTMGLPIPIIGKPCTANGVFLYVCDGAKGFS